MVFCMQMGSGMSFKGGIPILETERLLLRRYCKEDLQDLYEYIFGRRRGLMKRQVAVCKAI